MQNYHLSKLELTMAVHKVLEWFFAYPTKEFSLNELIEHVGISKTTANSVVRQLIKEGFLQKEEIGKTWRLSCNQKHGYNLTRKVPFHLTQIYESGIIEDIQKKLPQAQAIILFGSYRKGDDTEKSDIDIAVEIPGEKETLVKQLGIMQGMGYRKDTPVQATIFCRKKVDLNLFANIANGIILVGFLEVQV